MRIVPWLLLFVLSSPLWAREDHAKLGADVLTIGQERYLALTIQHEPKWHTYWKNPGDAGIATQFKFLQGATPLELTAAEWPAPHRYIEAGDILTYGYEGDPTFFFRLGAVKGDLKAEVKWLVCKDICLPGGQDTELRVEPNGNVIIKTARSGLSDSELLKRHSVLPKAQAWPSELEVYLSRTSEKALRLDYTVRSFPADKLDRHRNLLTPFLAPPMGFKKEELRQDEKARTINGRTLVEWDGEYQDPPRPLPANGVFAPPVRLRFLYQTPDGETWILEKDFTHFSLTATGLEENFQGLGGLDVNATPAKGGYTSNLAIMLLFAFIGGLILNLMPCVLPVISLKLFGLIKYQALPRSRVLTHNLAYSAGVIGTFLTLAGVIVALKASGEAVGWGFQLQSPLFVLGMVTVLFVMALNLFGLFEFAVPGSRLLNGGPAQDGLTSDVLSGVLSTILSTPCSAPFLGTALAFAFTGNTATIMLVFAFVGLGLAFPFLLTGAFPRLIAFLPRPGAWMEKLKYFLGVTLLITVAWLSNVFLSLVDPSLWLWPLALLFITLFFAFFFRARISRNPGLNLLFFVFPVALVLGAVNQLPLQPPIMPQAAHALWTPWTPQSASELQGQWVFMDFTAEWCLTCKVNKRLVLDTAEFEKMAAEKNLKLVRGDWTQRDERIAKFLESHGVYGVPAYFIQKPDGTVVKLGETVSIGKVVGSLK